MLLRENYYCTQNVFGHSTESVRKVFQNFATLFLPQVLCCKRDRLFWPYLPKSQTTVATKPNMFSRARYFTSRCVYGRSTIYKHWKHGRGRNRQLRQSRRVNRIALVRGSGSYRELVGASGSYRELVGTSGRAVLLPRVLMRWYLFILHGGA